MTLYGPSTNKSYSFSDNDRAPNPPTRGAIRNKQVYGSLCVDIHLDVRVNTVVVACASNMEKVNRSTVVLVSVLNKYVS